METISVPSQKAKNWYSYNDDTIQPFPRGKLFSYFKQMLHSSQFSGASMYIS